MAGVCFPIIVFVLWHVIRSPATLQARRKHFWSLST